MKLARAIHLDDSDQRVFANPAGTQEWCIAGGFEFSDWTEADLTGKPRQAFAHGWLGLSSFGRATCVAVTPIRPDELAALTDRLADHFVTFYGAPSAEAARPVAAEELAQMLDLCGEHDDNTLLTVARELTPAGVRETYRAQPPQAADLAQFAVHGDLPGAG